MASRDIWSRAGSLQIRDLLASLLSARLLGGTSTDPLYVCSPYLTDFPVFDNALGQFQMLFHNRPDFGERGEVLFSHLNFSSGFRNDAGTAGSVYGQIEQPTVSAHQGPDNSDGQAGQPCRPGQDRCQRASPLIPLRGEERRCVDSARPNKRCACMIDIKMTAARPIL